VPTAAVPVLGVTRDNAITGGAGPRQQTAPAMQVATMQDTLDASRLSNQSTPTIVRPGPTVPIAAVPVLGVTRDNATSTGVGPRQQTAPAIPVATIQDTVGAHQDM